MVKKVPSVARQYIQQLLDAEALFIEGDDDYRALCTLTIKADAIELLNTAINDPNLAKQALARRILTLVKEVKAEQRSSEIGRFAVEKEQAVARREAEERREKQEQEKRQEERKREESNALEKQRKAEQSKREEIRAAEKAARREIEEKLHREKQERRQKEQGREELRQSEKSLQASPKLELSVKELDSHLQDRLNHLNDVIAHYFVGSPSRRGTLFSKSSELSSLYYLSHAKHGNDYSTIKSRLEEILSIATKMGKEHPIFKAANQCYGLACQLKPEQPKHTQKCG